MTPRAHPKSLLIWAIQRYQQHLSPRKGYGCAYRLHHGKGSGCSGVGLRAIRRHGGLKGLLILRARLRRCAEVVRALRAQPKRRRVPAAQRGDCDLGCDPGDCADVTNLCDCDFSRSDDRRPQRRRHRWLVAILLLLLLVTAWCFWPWHP